MRLKKFLAYFLLMPLFIFAAVPVVIEDPQIMSYVDQNLPHQGVLKQTKEGFVYVELPRGYVFDILPMIDQSNVCPPPYFAKDKVGAHITVATPDEMAGLEFPVIPSLGQKISFTIVNFAHVQLENSVLGREIYMFTIKSPQIEEIRTKLGLTPKIKGYDFHITIAVDCGDQIK